MISNLKGEGRVYHCFSFSEWFEIFKKKEKNDEYTKLDDDDEQSYDHQPINPLRLVSIFIVKTILLK